MALREIAKDKLQGKFLDMIKQYGTDNIRNYNKPKLKKQPSNPLKNLNKPKIKLKQYNFATYNPPKLGGRRRTKKNSLRKRKNKQTRKH
jgi:hypothetical protein